MSEFEEQARTVPDLDLIRQEAMEFSGIGLYRYTLDGRVLFMDESALRILELDGMFQHPAEVVGKNVANLVIYARPEGQLRAQVQEREKLHGFECPFKTLKGTTKWAQHDSYLVTDAETGERAIQVVIRDITRQKEAERALARSAKVSEHLRSLMAAMNACRTLDEMLEPFLATALEFSEMDIGIVYLVEGEYAVLRHGRGLPEALAADAARVPLADPLAREVMRASRPVAVDDASPELAALLKPHGIRFIYGMPLRAGSEVFGYLDLASRRASPPSDGNLRLLGVMGLEVESLFSRLRVEEALRESEERYREILENIEEGYYEVDLHGDLRFFNRALCGIVGYSADELRGMSYRRYYGDPTSVKKVFQTFSRVYETGIATEAFDWEIVRKDGGATAVAVSVSLMRDGDGAPIGFRGLVRDVTKRKRAEKALRESEGRNRALLDAIPDSMARMTSDGTILDYKLGQHFTPGFRSRAEVLGANIRDLVPSWVAREALARVARVSELGRPEAFEFRVHRDRKAYDYEARIVNSGDDEVLAIIRDITERKHAEEALRQSEAKYRILFDACGEGILLETLDGQVLDANAAACRMFGYTREELTRVGIEDLVPEEYRGSFLDEAVRALEEGGLSCGAAGLRKDGSVFPAEVSSLPTQIDGNRVAVTYVRDVTQRAEAEKALRESEQRYRELYQNANDILYTHDLSGRFTSINRAGLRVSGYTHEEALQTNALEVVAPEYRELAREMVRRKLAGAETGQYELEMLAKDGSRIPVEVSTRLIYKDDEPVAVQGIARDITERRRAEEEHTRLEAQVQHAQKLESLGVLAGGLAHDFNNLLVGILGNAGLALGKLPGASPIRGYVEKIEATAQRAADLTNQMLAYSGKGTFIVQPLNLSRLVDEMAHLLEASISKKVTIKYEFEPDLPSVEGDAAQIQQVVMNLITNASDAIGDEPGVIALSARTMDIDVSYFAEAYVNDDLFEGRYVCVEVSDTGCGMDPATQARIFDPFFTTKFAGRGLGLAAVLGITRSHKGTIKVYSEPGVGTTVKVLFPALPAEVDAAEFEKIELQDRALHDWQASGTILVVDDGEEIREVARETYEQHGFKVLTAANGREGVDLFREHADELAAVLLDLTMPVMGGEKAFQEMHRIRADVPIILSSGYTEQDVTNRFPGRGPAAFIQKPFLPSRLIVGLRDVLEARGKGGGQGS
ncbi:MAG: PAS domain S-box protein [Candidatus Hydrogenedentes bacterium]|nr:PAS domain S-box protein [Candidatus Hydrogenedentota bacterium]